MFKFVRRFALSVLTITSGLAAFASIAQASELVFWSMWSEPEPQAQALRTIMSNYTKAHPETTFKAVWNGRQNQTKLRGAIQAGTKIDFMDQDGDQLAGGLQKEGQAYQIDTALGDTLKNDLLPGAYDIYASGEKHYQVPYIYNTVNFWYNKDMMKEANAAPPKTWDDLIKVCNAVSKAGKHALVVEGSDVSYALLYFSYLLDRMKGPNGLIKIFEDKTGQSWQDPVVMDAIKKELSLWDLGCFPKDARGFQYPQGQQMIPLGDAMADLNGSWLPTELSSSAGDDFAWGAFDFPEIPGSPGKHTDLQVALLSMAILKDAPHPDEAIGFMKYLVSEEAQKILVSQGGVGVTRKGVEWAAVLKDAYEAASNATNLTNIYGGLSINYADYFTNFLAPDHDKMFLGQMSPQDFVARMSSETKKYWARR
jgi:ABC-type glycerol-3-phosphate transport system substrate-binding protein